MDNSKYENSKTEILWNLRWQKNGAQYPFFYIFTLPPVSSLKPYKQCRFIGKMIITKAKCFHITSCQKWLWLLSYRALAFIAQCGKLKYTWSKEHQKETRNQALQWQVSFPEEGKLQRPHLKEALTTLPLTGCGGRQFPTRGTGGSFSALEKRLRSFAICKGQGKTVSMTFRSSGHILYVTVRNFWLLKQDKQTTKPVGPKLSGYQFLRNRSLLFVKTLFFSSFYISSHALWSKCFSWILKLLF